MLVAIDIGNTSISFAVMSERKIYKIYSCLQVSLKRHKKEDITEILKSIKGTYSKVNSVIICSVVPSSTRLVKSLSKEILTHHIVEIGNDLKVPIINHYKEPKQVGQDRLVCALAAKEYYGYPSIIIDFGTALTIDVVMSDGSYEGGIIVPGIQMSAESLYNKTALLPSIVSFQKPKRLIGRDTHESILSGMFYGYGVMCCGLIEEIQNQIEKKSSQKVFVVATGGYLNVMKKFIDKKVEYFDKDLVFKGMSNLYYNEFNS